MQPSSDTSAAPAEPPATECDPLLDLLPEVVEIILNKLTRSAVCTFAATSTTAFALVLERRTDLVEFQVVPAIARALASLGSSNSQRSVLCITCCQPPPAKQAWYLRMPLHAAARVCSPGGCTPTPAFTIPALTPETMHAVLPCVTRLEPAEYVRGRVLKVPPKMVALREVELDFGLRVKWMPACSKANVHTLHLARSSVERIPEGMAYLQTLEVWLCASLAADFLPASSAAALCMLSIDSTPVVRLPEGMRALRVLNATWCEHLAAEWLPVSSAGALIDLDIFNSPQLLERVPAGATALQCLNAQGITLAADWLPRGCKATLRTLDAAEAMLQRIPDGLTALQHVDVSQCRHLATEWLPPGSTAALQSVGAGGCNLEWLPEGMSQLHDLDVSNSNLEHLPSGLSKLTKLNTAACNIMRLPEGLSVLCEVDISRCMLLSEDWLPAACAGGVRVLKACNSALRRVPVGMAALEEADLGRCANLEAMPLPASCAARVRRLILTGTLVTQLPEGMLALESVSVDLCRKLAPDWLPASSAARLRALHAERSNMRALPPGTSELRVLSITGSKCHRTSIPAELRCLLEVYNHREVDASTFDGME